MAKVNVLVLTGYGTNSHAESAHAALLAGADRADIVHFSDIVEGEARLEDYHMLVFPGGFLDGDDLGAAQAAAQRWLHLADKAGVQSVAEILNNVDRATEEEVLSEIEEESSQMAEDIRNLMFVFEDCKLLDDRGMRELLKEVNNDDLTLALRGASDELKERFFKNMSERAGNMIREELEYMGPARLSEVEGAQQNIVKIVRRLEGANKIVINRGGGGDAFI